VNPSNEALARRDLNVARNRMDSAMRETLRLAEPVFDALEANEITLDVAKAYASTADLDRQAAVFELLRL